MEDFQSAYDRCRGAVDKALGNYFTVPCAQRELLDAMRYSLLAGGKRIRPVLTLQFCAAAGGVENHAMAFACGVEMLHTYSLIHDDLPCMDNDALRRGKPTCHKVYGETVATLAGDALQTAAFYTVLTAPDVWGGGAVPGMAGAFLAQAAGEQGMCGGQYLDTMGDGRPHTVEELTAIHEKKTGALLRAACQMGVCAGLGAGAADSCAIAAAEAYANALGMAFQIRDDLLDVTATTEELGKPVGSDAVNGKTTFVSLLGVEKCERLVLDYTGQAKAALQGVFPDNDFLCWLADRLALRSN